MTTVSFNWAASISAIVLARVFTFMESHSKASAMASHTIPVTNTTTTSIELFILHPPASVWLTPSKRFGLPTTFV